MSAEPISIDGLVHLEAVIERGRPSFNDVTAALLAIREQQLYRERGFEHFDDYCEQYCGLHQLVEAGETVLDLIEPEPVFIGAGLTPAEREVQEANLHLTDCLFLLRFLPAVTQQFIADDIADTERLITAIRSNLRVLGCSCTAPPSPNGFDEVWFAGLEPGGTDRGGRP